MRFSLLMNVKSLEISSERYFIRKPVTINDQKVTIDLGEIVEVDKIRREEVLLLLRKIRIVIIKITNQDLVDLIR